MRRRRSRALLAIGIPLLALAVLAGAWAVTGRPGAGRAATNVEVEGRDVGGRSEGEVSRIVRGIAAAFARTPVEIRAGEATYRATAADVGLSVDESATTAAVMRAGRRGFVGLRPLRWLASFAYPVKVAARHRVDRNKLRLRLVALQGRAARAPQDPVVVGTPDSVGIRPGRSGQLLDDADVASKLVADAARRRNPIVIETRLRSVAPAVSDEAARALAAKLAVATSAPLEVRAGLSRALIPTATVRSWIGSTITDAGIRPALDADAILRDLRQSFDQVLTTTPKDASITLVGNQVVITPSQDGQRCCARSAADQILAALERGRRSVTIPLIADKAAFTTEDAKRLGIKEPIGTTTIWKGQPQVKSFTTYYVPGQPRVTNIHRIADIVRGTIIKPGEVFSLNGRVGERTLEKGFIPAPAIAEGEMVQAVGGGVSQFATTTFNAAFFAGLPFVAYQSHSEVLDRYPYGREATVDLPAPDLKFRNDTPYGIMIWTSYTDTSVTVQLWSTQTKYAQQTGQTQTQRGACTLVTTQRTIYFPDGKTKVDEVHATYRGLGRTTC
ncbi:MAG: VanW family protein [Actinobacteria bacterium]|nr:VanW family protein [Actinomycetota bacterium]